MNYFESSARVPLLISHPAQFTPHRVSSNVSTLDILPTMCDLVGTKPAPFLPMDGVSLLPHLEGRSGEGSDEVFAEYTGEGTVRPLMMIRRGRWKYVTCPADGSQLYDLAADPLELEDLVRSGAAARDDKTRRVFEAFEQEARDRWDFEDITRQVLHSQRKRRLVWDALTKGRFTSWDFNPEDDGREKYVFFLPMSVLVRLFQDGANTEAGTFARTFRWTTWSAGRASLRWTNSGARRARSSSRTRLALTGSERNSRTSTSE